MVDGKDRLASCQAEMQARGYKDVKFFFSAITKPISEVAGEVADVLSAVLNKRVKQFKPFGDSTRA